MSSKHQDRHQTEGKHHPRQHTQQVEQAGGNDRKQGKQSSRQVPPQDAEKATPLPAGSKQPVPAATAAPAAVAAIPVPNSAASGDDGVMSTPTKRR